MDKSSLCVTPAPRMHNIICIKSVPDPAQICAHLMADGNGATKSARFGPYGVLSFDGRDGLRDRSVARIALVCTANVESLGRAGSQVLRSVRTRPLRHRSDRLESPQRPGEPRWRSSNPTGNGRVWKTSANPVGRVRLLRRPVLLCGRSEHAGGAEQPATC